MKIMHDVFKMCGWKYLQEESNLWYDRYSKKIMNKKVVIEWHTYSSCNEGLYSIHISENLSSICASDIYDVDFIEAVHKQLQKLKDAECKVASADAFYKRQMFKYGKTRKL